MSGEFAEFGNLIMPAKQAQNRSKRHSGRGGKDSAIRKLASPLGLLLLFCGLTFLMGGGSRSEISSLIVLRPLAVLALGAGLLTLRWDHIRQFKVLFMLAASVFALVVLHLIPLPPAIWQSLPGREIVMDVDALAGLESLWRPLSLDPPGTWNAFWSLFVPLAGLVLAVQLDEQEYRIALAWLILMGLTSALWAIPQLLGDPNGSLYLYRVTNNGSAVGLFANRNHQAVLLACLVPMMASWAIQASKRGRRRYFGQSPEMLLAYIAALVLVPLVLVTGSRAGLLTMLLGFGLSCWCMGLFDPKRARSADAAKSGGSRSEEKAKRLAVGGVIAAVPMLAIGLGVFVLGRGEAINRLESIDYAGDLRGQIAPVIVDLFWLYSPLGSGVGAFENVFKVHETEWFLGPAYVNHVHNDYLEVLMTGGIIAAVLLLIAILAALIAIVRIAFKPSQGNGNVVLARAGASALLLLAIASAVDYPLRVPSIQLLAILSAVWLSRGTYQEIKLQKSIGNKL